MEASDLKRARGSFLGHDNVLHLASSGANTYVYNGQNSPNCIWFFN